MKGGYRQGSGRSKSGYYNGIYCGSTYELCWVIYNLDHAIKFTRFPGKLEKDNVAYYPDFLLSDGKTIVETKGYEKQEFVDKKTKVAESFGYSVVVLRKEDLQYAFEYVTQKYGADKVAQIITFGRMKARAALRDVGRVLDINLAKVDKIAKLIPAFSTLGEALKENAEIRELYTEDS